MDLGKVQVTAEGSMFVHLVVVNPSRAPDVLRYDTGYMALMFYSCCIHVLGFLLDQRPSESSAEEAWRNPPPIFLHLGSGPDRAVRCVGSQKASAAAPKKDASPTPNCGDSGSPTPPRLLPPPLPLPPPLTAATHGKT